MSEKPFVPVITGATASGKSAWALRAAQKMNGEIICMDSMQIYRGMDIGTAKPTPEEQQIVPHHMLDLISPKESYAVADYVRDVTPVIEDVLSRGKIPFLVGGTGLYLKALMHGMALGSIPGDESVRAKYHAEAEKPGGRERLFAYLKAVDPVSAEKLHPNDLKRVIRALEVFDLTGKTISNQPKPVENECPYRIVPLVLHKPREKLILGIEQRIDRMLSMGLVNEVRSLLADGVPADAQSLQGIGYKELIPYLYGKCTLEEARWQMILNTRHYAKRQETWFRGEPACIWLDEINGSYPPPGPEVFHQ